MGPKIEKLGPSGLLATLHRALHGAVSVGRTRSARGGPRDILIVRWSGVSSTCDLKRTAHQPLEPSQAGLNKPEI